MGLCGRSQEEQLLPDGGSEGLLTARPCLTAPPMNIAWFLQWGSRAGSSRAVASSWDWSLLCLLGPALIHTSKVLQQGLSRYEDRRCSDNSGHVFWSSRFNQVANKDLLFLICLSTLIYPKSTLDSCLKYLYACTKCHRDSVPVMRDVQQFFALGLRQQKPLGLQGSLTLLLKHVKSAEDEEAVFVKWNQEMYNTIPSLGCERLNRRYFWTVYWSRNLKKKIKK